MPPTPSTPAYRAAILAGVGAVIARNGCTRIGPDSPPVQAYRAPVYCPPPSYSTRLRARNLKVLTDRVTAWIDFASGMGDAAASDAYLDTRAEHVNAQIARLACGATPDHLKGLDVFDLTEARERIAAAAVRLSRAKPCLVQAERVGL